MDDKPPSAVLNEAQGDQDGQAPTEYEVEERPKQVFNWSSSKRQIVAFFLGLIGISLVGLLLGATLNESLVSHSNEYFGELSDYFSIKYALPIAFALFGIIALVTRSFLYLIYPIVAFYLGQYLVSSDLVRFLSGNVPASVPAEKPLFFNFLFAVMISYALVYMVEKPIRSILIKMFSGLGDKTTLVTSIGILIFMSAAGALVSVIDHSLYVNQLRARSFVRVPADDTFIASVQPSGYITRYNYEVTPSYEEIEKTKQRSYIGEVSVKQLEKWWQKDTHTVCGDIVSNSLHPDQRITQTYKTTPGGLLFAESVFQANASKPATKTNEYQVAYSCFVIDHQRYDLTRSSKHGEDVLGRYKTEDIIDSIVSGTKIVAICGYENTSLLRQCLAGDKQNIEEIKQAQQEASLIVLPEDDYGYKLINPSAYVKSSELELLEWGIKLPLPEEVKDLVYTSPVSDATQIKGTFKSIADQQCGAGGNATVMGTDIVFIARRLNSENDVDSSVSFRTPNKQIGDYLYAVYLSGKAGSCLSDERVLELGDVLDWVTVNIELL